MGKRRKLNGKAGNDSASAAIDPASARLNIRSFEDVADSEDEFHLNRDKVLLDEDPAQRKRRKLEAEEQFFEASDEEVLDIPDDESDFDSDHVSRDDGAEESHFQDRQLQIPEDELGSRSSANGEEEDREEWGGSKRDYYNADPIETEADALEEEQEALRLQKKQLQSLSKADFGFDEIEWLDSEQNIDQDGLGNEIVQEVIPQLEITDSMTPEEKYKIFVSRYPEFEPLSKEFLALQPLHEALVLSASATRSVKDYQDHDLESATRQQLTIAEVKASALGSYLAVISMYFALLTSGPNSIQGQSLAKPPAELRQHPIMDTLVSCRSLWENLRDVPSPDITNTNLHETKNHEIPVSDANQLEIPNASSEKEIVAAVPEKRSRRRKSKAQKAAELALAEANASRTARLKRMEDDLTRITRVAMKRNASQSVMTQEPEKIAFENSSDIGEEVSLTPQEAAEKARRKRSLRFYTSQITQKSNKRGNAGRDAGGDADIPYRERFKDRQARLNAEAEAKGRRYKGAPTEPLGGDSDEEDRKLSREIREDKNSDDYYNLVASRVKEKKDSKAAFASAQREAAVRGAVAYEVEKVGLDGKRAISYAIEKNKGLTPKRKKDVRNPRVKKRKKFEEKKKKLGSIRQIYKGGEGRGGYGGELTGIKTNLVKSVKL